MLWNPAQILYTANPNMKIQTQGRMWKGCKEAKGVIINEFIKGLALLTSPSLLFSDRSLSGGK